VQQSHDFGEKIAIYQATLDREEYDFNFEKIN